MACRMTARCAECGKLLKKEPRLKFQILGTKYYKKPQYYSHKPPQTAADIKTLLSYQVCLECSEKILPSIIKELDSLTFMSKLKEFDSFDEAEGGKEEDNILDWKSNLKLDYFMEEEEDDGDQ